MKNEKLLTRSLLAASIAMITACGGSGSGTTTATDTGSTTSGVITGFGSVYINGVKYETDTAYFSSDDADAVERDLSVGDVCVLQGTVNPDGLTGVATSVDCDDELEGYVLDKSGLVGEIGTINVMGQNVSITADTVFSSDSAADISEVLVNDIIEVHGFSDGLGGVVATRVETKNAAEDVEVKGLVSSLDAGATTFMLGSLKVDYSSAAEVPADLVDGLYVEVKTESALTGDLASVFTLHASKVEIEDDGDMDIDGDSGEELEVQGMISGLNETTFLFNGSLIELSEIDVEDNFILEDGMMITMEGYIDAAGNFVAEEVVENYTTELETTGTVTEKTETSVTITTGSGPMTFLVNNSTRMIDEQDEGSVTPLHYFSLADVLIDDYVEIEYYEDTAGDLIATELEREDAPQT